MKHFLFSFSFIGVFFISPVFAQNDSLNWIARNIQNKYESLHSMSYTIHYKMKFLSSDDTSYHWNAECKIIKAPKDSLYKLCFWFKNIGGDSDGKETYYDLENVYEFFPDNDTVTIYRVHDTLGLADYFKSASEKLMNIYFLSVASIVKNLTDTSNIVQLHSVTHNGEDCYLIEIYFPDEEGCTEMRRNVYIREKDFTIINKSFQLKYDGDYQYDEWDLTDITFNTVTKEKLSTYFKNKTKKYKHHIYTPEKYVWPEPLEIGTIAPPFIGTDHFTGKQISLDDLRGKITILDFSYMSCHFCVLSIPHLVEIQKEYADKDVVVLWLDAFDGEEKRKKRLTDFIDKHSINYPILLISRDVDHAYHVSGYPTIYVVGKDGKIINVFHGYSEKLKDELKSFLDAQ